MLLGIAEIKVWLFLIILALLIELFCETFDIHFMTAALVKMIKSLRLLLGGGLDTVIIIQRFIDQSELSPMSGYLDS